MVQSYSPVWENGAIEPNLQISGKLTIMGRLPRHRASSRDFRHHARRALQTGLPGPASTLLIVRFSRMNIKRGGCSDTAARSRLRRDRALPCDRGRRACRRVIDGLGECAQRLRFTKAALIDDGPIRQPHQNLRRHHQRGDAHRVRDRQLGKPDVAAGLRRLPAALPAGRLIRRPAPSSQAGRAS